MGYVRVYKPHPSTSLRHTPQHLYATTHNISTPHPSTSPRHTPQHLRHTPQHLYATPLNISTPYPSTYLRLTPQHFYATPLNISTLHPTPHVLVLLRCCHIPVYPEMRASKKGTYPLFYSTNVPYNGSPIKNESNQNEMFLSCSDQVPFCCVYVSGSTVMKQHQFRYLSQHDAPTS
jgi:hypothetical protein